MDAVVDCPSRHVVRLGGGVLGGCKFVQALPDRFLNSPRNSRHFRHVLGQ